MSGLMLGLALIIPFGPQNMFVMESGLAAGVRSTMLVVTVCSLSDALLIVPGTLGVGSELSRVPVAREGLLAAGVVFLGYIGGRALFVKGAGDASAASGMDYEQRGCHPTRRGNVTTQSSCRAGHRRGHRGGRCGPTWDSSPAVRGWRAKRFDHLVYGHRPRCGWLSAQVDAPGDPDNRCVLGRSPARFRQSIPG